MAAMMPIAVIFKTSVTEIRLIFFNRRNNTHIVADVKSRRYQTNSPSFNVMRRPNIPVKPARKTARWSCRKAFFMSVVRNLPCKTEKENY